MNTRIVRYHVAVSRETDTIYPLLTELVMQLLRLTLRWVRSSTFENVARARYMGEVVPAPLSRLEAAFEQAIRHAADDQDTVLFDRALNVAEDDEKDAADAAAEWLCVYLVVDKARAALCEPF